MMELQVTKGALVGFSSPAIRGTGNVPLELK